jgi:hypothetical protein
VTASIGTPLLGALHVSPTFVFVSVWLNQMGVPIPVVPTLILATIGSIAAAVVGSTRSYVAFKWWERHRYSSRLRTASITVDDLHDRMHSHSPPLIVDVRTHTAHALEPRRSISCTNATG